MTMYRVSYTMDVEADTPVNAARTVARMLSDSSVPRRGVYEVIDRGAYLIDLDDPAYGGRGEFQ